MEVGRNLTEGCNVTELLRNHSCVEGIPGNSLHVIQNKTDSSNTNWKHHCSSRWAPSTPSAVTAPPPAVRVPKPLPRLPSASPSRRRPPRCAAAPPAGALARPLTGGEGWSGRWRWGEGWGGAGAAAGEGPGADRDRCRWGRGPGR